VGAYLLWGLFPLYWPLLEPASPVEILGHRIVWSLVLLVVVLAVTAGFAWVRRLSARVAALLTVAAILVSVNWAVYIYGVNSEHVVETSLGYFMNPLVTVVLAMVFLHERLRRRQGLALAVAVVGVLVLTIDYGRVPWIALTLAVTFGSYGLVKNRAGIDGPQSLAVETAVVVLPASAYLLWLGGTGDGTFTTEGPGHAALLIGAGVVTALPLMLFGAAAVRIRLSTLGLLQYMTPTLQLLCGVWMRASASPSCHASSQGTLHYISCCRATWESSPAPVVIVGGGSPGGPNGRTSNGELERGAEAPQVVTSHSGGLGRAGRRWRGSRRVAAAATRPPRPPSLPCLEHSTCHPVHGRMHAPPSAQANVPCKHLCRTDGQEPGTRWPRALCSVLRETQIVY